MTVVDDQTHRNATVDEFHGFPTRDATGPNRFREDALTELHSYGVTVIRVAGGTTVRGDAMVLATGVHDELPQVDGLAGRWGKSVFNCPFCDGWEHRDQPVVVIDAAPGADHLATLVRSWTTHVTVVAAADVVALVGDGTTLSHVARRDGSSIAATAAFVKATVVPRSSIARTLGCEVRHRRLHRHQRDRSHQPSARLGRRRRASPAADAASSRTRRSRRLLCRHCHPQGLRHTLNRVRPAGSPRSLIPFMTTLQRWHQRRPER